MLSSVADLKSELQKPLLDLLPLEKTLFDLCYSPFAEDEKFVHGALTLAVKKQKQIYTEGLNGRSAFQLAAKLGMYHALTFFYAYQKPPIDEVFGALKLLVEIPDKTLYLKETALSHRQRCILFLMQQVHNKLSIQRINDLILHASACGDLFFVSYYWQLIAKDSIKLMCIPYPSLLEALCQFDEAHQLRKNIRKYLMDAISHCKTHSVLKQEKAIFAIYYKSVQRILATSLFDLANKKVVANLCDILELQCDYFELNEFFNTFHDELKWLGVSYIEVHQVQLKHNLSLLQEGHAACWNKHWQAFILNLIVANDIAIASCLVAILPVSISVKQYDPNRLDRALSKEQRMAYINLLDQEAIDGVFNPILKAKNLYHCDFKNYTNLMIITLLRKASVPKIVEIANSEPVLTLFKEPERNYILAVRAIFLSKDDRGVCFGKLDVETQNFMCERFGHNADFKNFINRYQSPKPPSYNFVETPYRLFTSRQRMEEDIERLEKQLNFCKSRLAEAKNISEPEAKNPPSPRPANS